MFATCSFGIALHMIISARGVHLHDEQRASQQANLRPRLALVYLIHWSLDTAHLFLAGSAEDAVAIGSAMLRSTPTLALLFGLVTAMVGATRGCRARTTMLRLATAQGVLGLRAYLTWCELCSAWGQAAADKYAFAAGSAQVMLPLVTMLLAHMCCAQRSPRDGITKS